MNGMNYDDMIGTTSGVNKLREKIQGAGNSIMSSQDKDVFNIAGMGDMFSASQLAAGASAGYTGDTAKSFNDMVGGLSAAAKNDAVRWRGTQNYCDNSSMTSRKNDFLNRLNHRIQWLYSQWGEGTKPATWDVPEIESSTPKDAASKLLLPDGRIVIRRGNQVYDLNGRPVNF